MEHAVEDTRERILHAAVRLIREKGYKATTTLAIAREAGVNEVTIFRHFGNKQGIVEAAFERAKNGVSLRDKVEGKLIGELEADLHVLAHTYMNMLEQNRDAVVISFRESFPFLEQRLSTIPLEIRGVMCDYLTRMQEQGHVRVAHIESTAMQFLFQLFGYFVMLERYGVGLTHVTPDEFIAHVVPTFARGLRP